MYGLSDYNKAKYNAQFNECSHGYSARTRWCISRGWYNSMWTGATAVVHLRRYKYFVLVHSFNNFVHVHNMQVGPVRLASDVTARQLSQYSIYL